MAAGNNNALDYTELQAILAAIKTGITDKKQPNPDPILVSANDLSDIQNRITNYLLKNTTPPPPSGVTWISRPGTPIINNDAITETASSLSNSGATVNVAQQTISVPFAATDGKRTDAIVVNYLAAPAVYERVAGVEDHYLNPSAFPTLPADRLFVRYVTVTDGLVEVNPEPGVIPLANPATQTDGTRTWKERVRISRNVAPYVVETDYSFPTPPTITYDAAYEYWVISGATVTVSGVNHAAGSYMGAITFDGAPLGLTLFAFEEDGDWWIDALIYDLDDSIDIFPAGWFPYKHYVYDPADNSLTERTDWGATGTPTTSTPLRQTKTITANYTVTAADHNYTILVNAAAPIVITLPTGISGADIIFKQVGAGSFEFSAGSGATVENLDAKYKSAGAKAVATVFSDDNNVWTPNGQLVA